MTFENLKSNGTKSFRMMAGISRENFDILLKVLQEDKGINWKKRTFSLENSLLATIRRLTFGHKYEDLSKIYGVSGSCICKNARWIISVLKKHNKLYIIKKA